MKLYSWNVNGIRAVHKKGDLQRFLDEHTPDIVCLQETKAHQKDTDIDFGGYEEYWNSADKKGYSGTAILTKETPIDVFRGLPAHISDQYALADSYGDTTTEGRVITLEFEPFYVVSVYTPNAKDDLSRIPMRLQWDPAFLAYMVELEAKKPVLFAGDFNVAHTPLDLARPKENAGKKGFTEEERRGFEAFLSAGFVDSYRHLYPTEPGAYTWWSHWGGARERNVGWRIDYILISHHLVPHLKQAAIHPEVYGSDHCPVSIELTLPLSNE